RRLDSQRTLSRSGRPFREAEVLALQPDLGPETRESCGGEDDSIQLTGLDAREARVDVTADVDDLCARSADAHLGDAAGGPGTDLRPGGQCVKRYAVTGDHDIAGVFAHRGRSDHEPVGDRRRQIFEGVNKDVALAGEQRFAQTGSEDTEPADLRK